MTGDVSEQHAESVSATREWPTFALTYTFDPGDLVGRGEPAPDELVVFDPARSGVGSSWLTAERGSYVSIEDAR